VTFQCKAPIPLNWGFRSFCLLNATDRLSELNLSLWAAVLDWMVRGFSLFNLGRMSNSRLDSFTVKKLECSKQAFNRSLNNKAWDNGIGLFFPI